MKQSAILVAHPAFGYFCKDYDLIQLSIEIEGKEPLPKDISNILHAAKEHTVRSVFTEPQYSTKGAELIAKQLKIPVYMVDPYSSDYIQNLKTIATLIRHA